MYWDQLAVVQSNVSLFQCIDHMMHVKEWGTRMKGRCDAGVNSVILLSGII